MHTCNTQEANMSCFCLAVHTGTCKFGAPETMVAVLSGSFALTNIARFLLLQLVLPRLVPGTHVSLGRPHWSPLTAAPLGALTVKMRRRQRALWKLCAQVMVERPPHYPGQRRLLLAGVKGMASLPGAQWPDDGSLRASGGQMDSFAAVPVATDPVTLSLEKMIPLIKEEARLEG